MLTIPERILFSLAALLVIILTARATFRIIRVIGRGYGKPEWGIVPSRLVRVLLKTVTFSTVFTRRPLTSIFHGMVAWAFIYYLLVNLGDVLEGFIQDFIFLGEGILGDLYRLGADILSGLALIGMAALLLRRFLVDPTSLKIREGTLVHPLARQGMRRDSLIVGGFILLHVGARFVSASFQVSMAGGDVWQPLASALGTLWSGFGRDAVIIGRHLGWWIALGAILVFFPYFPRTKHIHLFMAPLNLLLQPERRSIGELSRLDFEDESVEQFGAERIEDLSWSAMMDAYACIMCNRCQDACPAYETGKVLSPAALEINKRYFINQEFLQLSRGAPSSQRLTEFAISPEAVWACTACGACVDVCPVGNEPMRDILEIRQHLVLMENVFPEALQAAYRGMERAANPWNIGPEERLSWAEGYYVPTIADNPEAEILWWVGCAPATDPRAQKTAISFATILNQAEVNYAILGDQERCSGDSARRSGNEYLFSELAQENVSRLKSIAPKRIVTTCPHCLHTLKNEYPAFGGDFEVIHHSQLLDELIDSGRIQLNEEKDHNPKSIALHDPCYLGRHNNILLPPRSTLEASGAKLQELSRSGKDSFCCGAGGGQMWKEEEHGSERVSMNRLREALDSGVDTLAVACPFCMIMLNDAAVSAGAEMKVEDIVEIVARSIDREGEVSTPISRAVMGSSEQV